MSIVKCKQCGNWRVVSPLHKRIKNGICKCFKVCPKCGNFRPLSLRSGLCDKCKKLPKMIQAKLFSE